MSGFLFLCNIYAGPDSTLFTAGLQLYIKPKYWIYITAMLPCYLYRQEQKLDKQTTLPPHLPPTVENEGTKPVEILPTKPEYQTTSGFPFRKCFE